MKRLGIISFVLFALVVSLLIVRHPQPAHADDDAKPKGQLQGMVTDSDGDPIFNYQGGPNFMGRGSVPIRLYLDGQETIWGGVDQGGLYRIPNLKPGLYEVIIYPKSDKERPQRFLGVLIKGGEPTSLDIKFHKGTKMEVVGKPLINIPPAIIVSEELENLHKEIDELKKVIEELKKK